MASSIAAISLRDPIVPLQPRFRYEDIPMVKIEHKWMSAGQQETSKYYLPTVGDPSEKEMILYTIDQFIDATDNTRLHLSSGASLYSKFREVLKGDLRLTFQTISDDRDNKSVENFEEDLKTFIAFYFSPTAYEDQREYMRGASKPYLMSCEELGGRLRVMSNICRYLPGSNGDPLYPTPESLKRAYYALMLAPWKIKFAENGHNFEHGDYTYQDLIRFMSIQESLSKTRESQKRPFGFRQGPTGRGRGRYGNYQFQGGRGRFSNGRFVTMGYRSPRPYYSSPPGSYAMNANFVPQAPSTPRTESGNFNNSGRGPISPPRIYASSTSSPGN